MPKENGGSAASSFVPHLAARHLLPSRGKPGEPGVPELHVVAAIIEDSLGRVLLAQRSLQGEHPGLWEFPGGKVEVGEDAPAALRRELIEELGVELLPLRRLHCVRWREPERLLVLEGWRARVLSGSPHGRQGQSLQWVAKECLRSIQMPPADGPLCSALRLSERMWITPALISELELPEWSTLVDARLQAGVRLVQMRLPGAQPELLRLAAAVLAERCRAVGARWVLNGDPKLASAFEADGVHLSASSLKGYAERPVAHATLVGASCHSAEDLAHATRVGLDYATLSPLRVTATHPEARPLGDALFESLIRDCPLPVFALGGLATHDLDHVRALGAFGVAGIRGM